MSSRADHPIDLLTQTNWDDVATSGKPTTENKGMASEATSGDGDLACDTAIAKTPVFGGYVVVLIRGVQVSVGDGVKTKCCYFSGDGGTTARAFADVAAGDKLYWNGSVAGYQLQAGWRTDFYYLESYSGAVGGGGASVSGIITTGAVELWVRPVDGDDANSGTSSSTPLETIQAAVDKIPYIGAHKVVIHVGMHTGGGHAAWILGPRLMRANIWIIFDGGGAVGDDGFTEILAPEGIGVIDQGHLDLLSISSLHQYRGKTVEVLTGAAAGDRRTIQDSVPSGPLDSHLNTYTCADFSPGIANGDLVRIVEPKAAFYLPPARDGRASELRAIVTGCGHGSTNYYGNTYEGKVFIVNAKVKPDADLGFGGLGAVDSNVVFLGCELDPLVILVEATRSAMMYGVEDNAYEYWIPSSVNDGVGATQRSSWFGWGIYGPYDGSPGYYFSGDEATRGASSHSGIIVVPGITATYGNLLLRGGNLFGHGSSSIPTLDVAFGEAHVSSDGSNKTLIRSDHVSSAAVRAWYLGSLFITHTKIEGIGDGIRVMRGSVSGGWFGAGGFFAEIDVDGFGIRLSRGGQMDVGVSGGGSGASIVGAAGDISMDDGGSSFGGETVTSNTSLFDSTHGTALWGR